MNSGFTLIETLIVIAILGILTAMFLGYNDVHTGQLSLYVDRSQVIGVLQRAKSLALEKYAENSDVCAYGVHWVENSGEYFIYTVSSSTSPCKNFEYSSGNSNYQLMQTFSLNGRNVFTKSGNAYFVPPYFTSSSDVTINIKNKDTEKIVNIKIQGNSIWSPD